MLEQTHSIYYMKFKLIDHDRQNAPCRLSLTLADIPAQLCWTATFFHHSGAER